LKNKNFLEQESDNADKTEILYLHTYRCFLCNNFESQDLINENYKLQKRIEKLGVENNNKKIIYRNPKNMSLERLLENERLEKEFLVKKLVNFQKEFANIAYMM
jgi:Rps23 Pro-64 3,4-dihydroxylase Tpa1-like proline 4-hydroxylase